MPSPSARELADKLRVIRGRYVEHSGTSPVHVTTTCVLCDDNRAMGFAADALERAERLAEAVESVSRWASCALRAFDHLPKNLVYGINNLKEMCDSALAVFRAGKGE